MTSVIKYEISQIVKRKRNYILFLALILVSAFYYKYRLTNYMNSFFSENFKGVGIFDILLFIVAGASKEFLEASKQIDFPINYLIFLSYISIATYYIFDINNDNSIVLKIGSKKKWLLSKIVISIINLFLFYIMAAVISLIVSGFSTSLNKDGNIGILKLDFFNADIIDIVPLLGCSFLTALAIITIQIFFSIAISELIGIIVSIAIYILSAFSSGYYCIANGTMLARSSKFLSIGFDYRLFLLIDLVVIILFLIVSLIAINKKDFL